MNSTFFSLKTAFAALKRLVSLAAVVSCFAAAGTAGAQPAPGGFGAAAAPSRFELEAKAGEVITKTLEISHVGGQATEYVLRSADWDISEAKGLQFLDELQPDSCRTWLRLERRAIKMPATSKRKLRFEIHVPADAPVRECRFAILVENYDQKAMPLSKDSPIQLPLTGRLGVIVYVAIGGAEPKLEMTGLEMGEEQGQRVPFVVVKNTGNAHGRLDGALSAVDTAGRKLFFPVTTLPILPGQTRRLALMPAEDLQTKKKPKFTYPVKLSGRLDWEKGGFDINQEVK